MSDDLFGRRPGGSESVTRGLLRSSTLKGQQDLKKSNPDNSYGLGVARVTNVDYEGFLVTLRTLVGTSQLFERVAIPLTFPGAGARHFLGAMPQIGDYCIVGWMPQEAATADREEGTKTPVILSWILPGQWPGRDWLTTAEHTSEEYEPGPGERAQWSGAFDRIRHKLRHIQPGNVAACSAQGSDIVLDEGVTLSNRRGNEFRLRDQDQAAILRALQSFTALAGARIYAGMVQRDATFLPTTMISDGLLWDDGLQSLAGVPLTDQELSVSNPDQPAGYLTPSANLHKSPDSVNGLSRSFLAEDIYLDPYHFLRYGGYIDEFGYAVDGSHQADCIYGAKPIYRVTSQSTQNAAKDPGAKTLTEYRLEVTHTSDGVLPVTEQTDMFDAERVPGQDPRSASDAIPANHPYIEWVLGSVVGNDAFTQNGRQKYGRPLKAVVFEGDIPKPRLEPVTVAFKGSGIDPTPIQDHAATLFRLTPPMGGLPDTFISFNKQGQLRAAIGGDPKGNAVEAYLTGGLKLGIAGAFKLLLDGHTEFGTTGKSSMGIRAEEGCLTLFGGGPTKSSEATIEAVSGTGRGAGDLPSVIVEARTNMRIKAERKVLVKGQEIEVNASAIKLLGHESVEVAGVRKASISTESFIVSVSGKCQESYTGPKYLLPTNFPLHERTYAPMLPGYVCEKVTYAMGDREEIFLLGNHKTSVVIGNLTYQTGLGSWKAQAATSQMTLSPTGINALAGVGTISLTASAGTATMSRTAGVNIIASAGVATVKGSAGVYLGGPLYGPDAGPILCSGTLEPFTGLPFSTWGLGAKGHIIGA